VQRQALDRAIAAFNARDLKGYLELYGQRIALYGYSRVPMNKSEVIAFYESFFAAFSDIVLEPHEFAESRSKIGMRFTMSATHTGDIEGIPQSGGRFSEQCITVMHFDGDRVVERFSVADFERVRAQLRA
jgi:predicted ester cyclase